MTTPLHRNQHPRGPATEPPSSALRALLADLRILDERLQETIARLRNDQADPEADEFRGLLMDEADVDGWLDTLPARDEGAPPPVLDFRLRVLDRGEPAERPSPALERGDEPALSSAKGSKRAGDDGLQADGPLRQLGARFDLSPFDLRVVLTCLAPELSTAYGGLYAYVQDDVTRKYATVDLTLLLWCNSLPERLAARARFQPGAPLRRHRLLHLAEDSSPSPLLTHAITLDPRIIAFLLGAQDLDPISYSARPNCMIPAIA